MSQADGVTASTAARGQRADAQPGLIEAVGPAGLWQVGILAALLGLLFWPELRAIVHTWRHDGNWSHGFLLPVFSLYFLHTRRAELARPVDPRQDRPFLAMAGVLFFGLLWLGYSILSQPGVGFVGLLGRLAPTGGGRIVSRLFQPAVAVLYVMVPTTLLVWRILCRRAGVTGLILVVLGLYMYLSCWVLKIGYPKRLAIIVVIMGLVLALTGWARTRVSFFAVAFLVLAMPLPGRLYDQFTLPMRQLATVVSTSLLNLLPGLNVSSSGTVVEYVRTATGTFGTFGVEEACSGMRLLLAFCALGMAMAYLSPRPTWHRVVMAAICLPIAVFCNMVRVTITGVVLIYVGSNWGTGTPHTLLGLGMLVVAFGLFSLTLWILDHLFESTSEVDAGGSAGVAS